MIITSQTSSFLFTAYKAVFQRGFEKTPTHAFDVAMKVSSPTETQLYPWLGQFPQMREWTGGRQLKSVELFDYEIKNLKYESTITVPRTKIEDDQYGVFSPLMENMGRVTKLHPDQLVFGLLKNGGTALCYDGQPFFDGDHPSFDQDGNQITVSNVLTEDNLSGTAGPIWFLLDTSQALKPIIFQERIPYEFQTIVTGENERVFMQDEYLYGIRARVNVGFGFWQMAFASDLPLTPENFAIARASMQALRGDQGGLLGIMPNLVVVPPTLESSARTLLKATMVAGPMSNIWFESADLLVTPFLG